VKLAFWILAIGFDGNVVFVAWLWAVGGKPRMALACAKWK
jgi:hypothetical protein